MNPAVHPQGLFYWERGVYWGKMRSSAGAVPHVRTWFYCTGFPPSVNRSLTRRYSRDFSEWVDVGYSTKSSVKIAGYLSRGLNASLANTVSQAVD